MWVSHFESDCWIVLRNYPLWIRKLSVWCTKKSLSFYLVDQKNTRFQRPHEFHTTNLNPGHCLGKDQPDVDHLDVGGLRKAPWDADEEGGEDEEGGQVDRDDRLEEELLEEVGRVHDGEDQDGWQVDGEDGVEDTSSEDNRQLDALVKVVWVDVV